MAGIQSAFRTFVEGGVLLLEAAGVVILLYVAIKSIVRLFRRDSNVRMELAEGIALALEFKLGAEVLRTVIVRSWDELAILGAIVALRAAITFLIRWEINSEKKKLV